MKQRITLAIALAALLSFTVQPVIEVQAATQNEFKWEKFGTDSAYKSREAAMTDRANVFRKFGYSEAQVTCLVAATAMRGTIVRLNVGDHLNHMLSGHGVVHANTVIAFAEVTRGIQYTALAEEWTVICGGTSITIDLPQICFNWSDRQTPVPQQEACATLRIHVPAGRNRIVRGTTLRHEPITDFNCWGVIAGQYREGAPRNCDTCDWTGAPIAVMRQYGYGEVAPYNTFIYEIPIDATSHNPDGSLDVTIVLPAVAVKEGNAICIEVDGVTYMAATILPPSWKGLAFELPLDYWTHPRIINP